MFVADVFRSPVCNDFQRKELLVGAHFGKPQRCFGVGARRLLAAIHAASDPQRRISRSQSSHVDAQALHVKEQALQDARATGHPCHA